jgi:hypothetical protein
LQLALGFLLGVSPILGRIFLRIRPARPDLIIIVQYRLRCRLAVLGGHVDDESALPGKFSDVRLGRVGFAQLGVLAE